MNKNNGFWRLAAFGLFVSMAASGCYGIVLRDNAEVTAGRDHSCSRERVMIDEDVSDNTEVAFWVRTCGQRFLYVHRPVAGGDGEVARFYDVTAQALLHGRRR